MRLLKKIKNAGVSETLKEGTKLIDEIFTTQEEKLEGKKELFKMAVSDRDSARSMYAKDNWLQKLFAIFFLVVWFVLTALILIHFITDDIKLQDWQIAFISNINGGISAKMNTIVDFLFGGAIDSVNRINTNNKRKKKNEDI